MTTRIASLRDHFGEIFERSDRDPIQYIVALTYEFDDQQVLNLSALQPLGKPFEPRMTHLARIAQTVPVMIYDARKTGADLRLPHFMELLPVRMPVYTCHHPKAYLVITASSIHLVIGSMNLTRSGLFANREVFDTFRWTDKETEDRGVLAEFARILRSGYAPFDSAPLAAALTEIGRRLERWRDLPDTGQAVLIHQGYDARHGLAALAEQWTVIYGYRASPERIIVVSPFFDSTPEGRVLVDDMRETFPQLTQLDVITDEAVSEYLSQRHFRGFASTRLSLIPKSISGQERTRIEQANQPIDTTDHAIERKLHAKIVILARGDDALVYLGSGNFTRKAWHGGNRELGVARPSRGNVDSLLKSLCRSLSVDESDRFHALPATQPAAIAPSDDDYVSLPHYPDFVQGIELRTSETSDHMVFVVKTPANQVDRLSLYNVTWGAVDLRFHDGLSQPLDRGLLARCLLGGRNLRFSLRDNPSLHHYLPFRHSTELFAHREHYVFPTAEDWMYHHLYPDQPLDRDPDEYIPGDSPAVEDDPAVLAAATRDQNPVIRMQGYLNLFSRIEKEFGKRAKSCAETTVSELAERWEREIASPLVTFAEVIAHESKAAPTSTDTTFKLGELALLASRLASIHNAGKPLLDRLRAMLPADDSDRVVSAYLRFCHSQIQP
ncbi:hypothetical protein [Burkholderia cepacia]|uniref:PLD phosphodiesterase domain-containing protein n=1 Tax=Burkholderia cepacia TaxID=292 RepID=A0AAQ0JJ71_BURCE|nr:hypothetical protein [Burkholderia cepacia]MCE4129862.1 hypothetical protein [Burkholderia cepacia]MDN7856294.1 hypothetical protein [Burkholderia cepacia]RAQ05961.1 hypothetical protein DPR02_22570 [Burkholderia cepacia]